MSIDPYYIPGQELNFIPGTEHAQPGAPFSGGLGAGFNAQLQAMASMGPTTEADIRVLQDVLRGAGYDPGPTDGRFGPQTRSAMQAFQQANGWRVSEDYDLATRWHVGSLLEWIGGVQEKVTPPPVSPPPPPSAPPFPDLGGGFGGGGGVGGGGGGVAVPSVQPLDDVTLNLSDEEAERHIIDRLPQMRALLDIPGLRPTLLLAAREQWPGDKIMARVQESEWWRTTPERARNWTMLSATDPASAERQLQESRREFEQLAGAYLIPLSEQTLDTWTRQILGGKVPEDAFRGYLVEQAKSRWPTLGAALDAGVTVAQYAEPYKQIAARELELNPAAIDFMQPKWMAPLDHVDTSTGERTTMSLSDWTNKIRSDAQYGWDETSGAREKAAQFNSELLTTFGRVA